jgi:hypothetical protein
MGKIYNYYLNKEYFKKDQNDRLAGRIARYDFQKGDILRFYEIDENGKKTGKYYDRIIVDLHKIHKAFKYWNKEDLFKHGLCVFELEKVKPP